MNEHTQDIPLVNLSTQNEEVRDVTMAGFEAVLSSTAFVNGPEVAAFEREYAAYSQVEHCVGVANGTDALELALRALCIGQGDEVIIPANTFVATAEAINAVGASIVLVDCDENFLIDVNAVGGVLTSHTRAVIAVHLYGQLADVDGLRRVLRDRDVAIVEDAAQSQGARRDGGVSGGLADIAATSFYPGKNLGAFGDAGAITTNSDQLAERVKKLRNHGGIAKYEHSVVGRNSRLDSLQAVVLRAKLRRLDEWNAQRQVAAQLYCELLSGVGGIAVPMSAEPGSHVWHLFVVRCVRRDQLSHWLNRHGIGTGVHYPRPIHLIDAFRYLTVPHGAHPAAERASSEILSLPMYPGISADQQVRVVAAIQAFTVSITDRGREL